MAFLAIFLKDSCCMTSFVFNILYQMCHYPGLEMEEAAKWMKKHGKTVPDFLRGRISLCPLCMPSFRERCKINMGVGFLAMGRAEEQTLQNNVKPTDMAVRDSWMPEFDEWVISLDTRIIAPDVDEAKNKYTKEPGRKVRRPMKFMLLVDLVFHMVHAPRKGCAPEYRMLNRIVRTLGEGANAKRMAKKKGEEGVDTDAGMKCLYSAFPSIPMEILLMHVKSSMIELKGGKGGSLTVTIADRVYMSAYVSGGKRRVTRADSQVGYEMRRCNRYLARGGGGDDESEPEDVDDEGNVVYFGGVW